MVSFSLLPANQLEGNSEPRVREADGATKTVDDARTGSTPSLFPSRSARLFTQQKNRTCFGRTEPDLVHDIHGKQSPASAKRLKGRALHRILQTAACVLRAIARFWGPIAVSQYRREDVLRILRVPGRQLALWEKAGLMPPAEAYTFDHLVQLRKLRDLAATRISVRSIRRSVDAMQRVAGLSNPLLESAVVGKGTRLRFRQWGALVDPVTRQMAFDFDGTGPASAVTLRCPAASLSALEGETQEMFLRAVRLEESPATIPEAKTMYEMILQLQPRHAAAAINLGTILYGERNFAASEALYRRAIEADPDYALAYFDLGNVLDEQQRLREASIAYSRALELVPGYADAHYNLALALERTQEPRRALRHWVAYVRLDRTGPWAAHARAQIRRILGAEPLRIVSRHGRTLKLAGCPPLTLSPGGTDL